MPISIQCTINQVESCISGSPDVLPLANLSSTHKNIEDGDVISVLTIDDLPSAELNTGRMIFVESVGEYRYSDGIEWTNNYDTAFSDGNTLYQTGILITTQSANSPVETFPDIKTWIKTSEKGGYSGTGAAIKNDGSLWSWGIDAFGLMGVNTCNVNALSPVQEITSSIWSEISGTREDRLAIKEDGTMWGWGRNIATLGVANQTDYSSPIQEITSSNTWCYVEAGGRNVAAIKTDGTLWTWGCNGAGEVGGCCSLIFPTATPTQEISSSTNWSVSSSGNKTLYNTVGGIKSDGTLWLWGYNLCGQLGDGTRICRSSPVQEITSSNNWCRLSIGTDSTFTIKNDGTLWAWGRGTCYLLGDGGIYSRSSPVQEITSSTNWNCVVGSYCSASAIKNDGTLWAWGVNNFGELASSTAGSTITIPTKEVTSSSDWSLIGSTSNSYNLFKSTPRGFL